MLDIVRFLTVSISVMVTCLFCTWFSFRSDFLQSYFLVYPPQNVCYHRKQNFLCQLTNLWQPLCFAHSQPYLPLYALSPLFYFLLQYGFCSLISWISLYLQNEQPAVCIFFFLFLVDEGTDIMVEPIMATFFKIKTFCSRISTTWENSFSCIPFLLGYC